MYAQVKMSGTVEDCSVFDMLAVVREVDLFNKWVPFVSNSDNIAMLGRMELLNNFEARNSALYIHNIYSKLNRVYTYTHAVSPVTAQTQASTSLLTYCVYQYTRSVTHSCSANSRKHIFTYIQSSPTKTHSRTEQQHKHTCAAAMQTLSVVFTAFLVFSIAASAV